jgi:hypothetical protein
VAGRVTPCAPLIINQRGAIIGNGTSLMFALSRLHITTARTE